jgi:DnaJ-class molecular chaperone
VKKDMSSQDIRKAFFNLAKKYHPDLNSDKREEDREQAKVKF